MQINRVHTLLVGCSPLYSQSSIWMIVAPIIVPIKDCE